MSCALAGKQSRRVRLYFRSEEKEDALPQSWIMNHDNYIYIISIFGLLIPRYFRANQTQLPTVCLLCSQVAPPCRYACIAQTDFVFALEVYKFTKTV